MYWLIFMYSGVALRDFIKFKFFLSFFVKSKKSVMYELKLSYP